MAGEKTVRGTPSQEVEGVWRGVTSAHMVGEKIVRGTPSQGVEGPSVGRVDFVWWEQWVGTILIPMSGKLTGSRDF